MTLKVQYSSQGRLEYCLHSTGTWPDFLSWVAQAKGLRSGKPDSHKTPRAVPPSDEQQLASRKAAQQFWASTSSWEDTPPAVQEQARRTFGIKVCTLWPNVQD